MKSIQYWFNRVLVTILSIAVTSCCTKIYCIGFDGTNEIQMWNFTADEVDSIAFEIFQSGSNFTERLDSSYRSAHGRTSGDKDLIIFMPENISEDHEYKITLLSTGTGQSYTINNFTKTREACNECKPFGSGSDYYDVLESYDLNGQKVNSAVLGVLK